MFVDSSLVTLATIATDFHRSTPCCLLGLTYRILTSTSSSTSTSSFSWTSSSTTSSSTSSSSSNTSPRPLSPPPLPPLPTLLPLPPPPPSPPHSPLPPHPPIPKPPPAPPPRPPPHLSPSPPPPPPPGIFPMDPLRTTFVDLRHRYSAFSLQSSRGSKSMASGIIPRRQCELVEGGSSFSSAMLSETLLVAI